MSRYPRLTAFDRMYLADETSDWPCHFGGLALVESGPLLDPSGALRLDEIRARLERRLDRVPDLRQRLYMPGRLRGGPLWIDDPEFAISNHVLVAAAPAPGGEQELLQAATDIYARLLDRRRPLWELWFLTGLAGGHVGVLLKLHHAVADGNAAVAIMGSLFDAAADTSDPAPAAWRPARRPLESELLVDGAVDRLHSAARVLDALAHPRRLASGLRVFLLVARRSIGSRGAPGTSLNPVVGHGRRIGVMRLDLVAGQAVSTRSAGDAEIDNQAGTAVCPLPIGEPDPAHRLDLVVDTTRKVKAGYRPAAIMGALVAISMTPLGRYLNRHQRAVNVLVTNVVGPRQPMYLLGAPVLEVLPIIQLVGNVALTLAAFSYAGRMSLVVTADATGFPDLDVLMAGMERDWRALATADAPTTIPEPGRGAELAPALR